MNLMVDNVRLTVTLEVFWKKVATILLKTTANNLK